MINIFRNFLFVLTIVLALTIVSAAQSSEMCIIEQPLPKLPESYGTLDAQASVIFRVEFHKDGTLRKISPILSTKIANLDTLAREAVDRITFVPKTVEGEPITIHKMVQYRYSWKFGWRITKPKSQKYCPTPKTKKALNK